MRRRILCAAASAMLAAGPAQAADADRSDQTRDTAWRDSKCVQEMQRINEETARDEGRLRAISVGRYRNDWSVMRRTALIFARSGMDAKCQAVVEGMQAMIEREDTRLRRYGTGLAPVERTRRAQIQKAKPVASTQVRAETLIGAPLLNPSNEDLGTIEDIVVENGEIRYAVVSSGGFLGIGEEVRAVPWERLKVNTAGNIAILAVTESAFKGAPTFDNGERSRFADDAWRDRNRTHWQRALENGAAKSPDADGREKTPEDP